MVNENAHMQKDKVFRQINMQLLVSPELKIVPFEEINITNLLG